MPPLSPSLPPSPATRDSVVAALRAAGCVFAEDEAELILATAGTPDELARRADGTDAAGDAPLERGYTAALAQARS